jgi:hypothetical protein
MATIGDLAPYDVEEEDWTRHLQELADLILSAAEPGMPPMPPDDAAVLAWFGRWLPRCLSLIPPRRRQTFLQGVYKYLSVEGRTIGE